MSAAQPVSDAAFASDLGLRPGQWPRTLVYQGRNLFRGAEPERNAEGEIVSFTYRASDFRLVVWND